MAGGEGMTLLGDVVDGGGRSWEVGLQKYWESVAAVPEVLARACARGFTGTFMVSGQPRLVPREVPGLGWLDVVVVRVWFEGEAPQYGDWRILGSVGLDGSRVRVEPAAGTRLNLERELVGLQVGMCGHCHTRRLRRVQTLLLGSAGGQASMCVGKTCMTQVLGVRAVFLRDADLAEDFGWEVEDWLPTFTLESVIAVGHAAVAAFGWAPGTSVWSTARQVRAALGGQRSDVIRRTRAAMAPHLRQGWRVARSLAHRLASDREIDPFVASVAPWGAVTLEEVPVIVAALGGVLQEKSLVKLDVRSWL